MWMQLTRAVGLSIAHRAFPAAATETKESSWAWGMGPIGEHGDETRIDKLTPVRLAS